MTEEYENLNLVVSQPPLFHIKEGQQIPNKYWKNQLIEHFNIANSLRLQVQKDDY